MGNKPFWASKTLWVNAIAIIAAIAGAASVDLGLDPETQIAAVGIIMGVVNMILRFMTSTSITGAE